MQETEETMMTSRRSKRAEVAELVDLVVDEGVLFDVHILAGDVGLGLVVIVVGDEVLDGVVGEEFAELGAELGREGFVVGEDEGRAVAVGDDVGHGERLAGAGDAEEGLPAHAPLDALGEAFDGLGLVTGRVEGCDEAEFIVFHAEKS